MTDSSTSTDRIEKTVVLKASRSRVWRAIADADEFGKWFLVKLHDPFVEGATVRGDILHPGYEDMNFEMFIERIQPERYFSYRWHPHAVDPNVDYSPEPTTLVEFMLDDAPDGTRLTIVESGFDRIPLPRRLDALRMNDPGWSKQMANIERYVTGA
jgi:uncharacterized protein YndB with AHSA1/START domain